MNDLRDTSYAKELARATVEYEGGELRIERLYVKEKDQEAVRFSWWKDGKMPPRPLDLPEAELLMLLERAIGQQVFTPNFLQQLRGLLNCIEAKHRGLYGKGGAPVWLLISVQLLGAASVALSICAAYWFFAGQEPPYFLPNLREMWAFWVLIPPAWFAIEYFYIFRRRIAPTDPGRFEGLKYGQEVASKVWLAVVGVLTVILRFC